MFDAPKWWKRRRRRKLVRELRSGRHTHQRKFVGAFLSPTAPVCFLGVVGRMAPKQVVRQATVSSRLVAIYLGITPVQVYTLMDINDESNSFEPVADCLEKM